MNAKGVFCRCAVLLMVIAALVAFNVKKADAQQSGDATADIAKTVDQIASDQKVILAELAAIKEQLRILTIRVTQQQ